MSKLDKDRANKFSPEETKRAQEDFVTHAWLGNWDAAGLEHDNLGTVAGVPTSLDLGGAMLYRGMGQAKGAAFGSKVEELNTLRNPKMNAQAASVFGSMTQDQVKASAEKVTKIPDDKIRDVIKSNGLPDQVADTLIARKKDIAQRVGLIAQDADFEESKHPRVKGGEHGGEFASGTGGGGGTSGTEEKPSKASITHEDNEKNYGGLYHMGHATPKENHDATVAKIVAQPAKQGHRYRKLVALLMKESSTFATHASLDKLKEKLAEGWAKTAEALAKKGKTAEAAASAKKAQSLGWKGEVPKAAPAAPAPAPAPTPAPAPPKPAVFPPATAAEMEKAKKNAKLQLQYVPGAPQGSYEAQKLVDKFNEKYEGKALATTEQLQQKVADFKALQASMVPLMSAEQKKAAANAEAQKAAAAQAAVAAKAQQEAQAKAAIEKNKGLMKDLGITEVEAVGFTALVGMLGGNQQNVVNSFKSYEKQAATLGYPITGFQCALIRNYSDGGYAAINKALRTGTWTKAQQVYLKMVNKALAGMPRHTGDVNRGTDLTPQDQARYIAGNIVEERAFTSTSTSGGFGGNTSFKIKAIGKRGASIKKLSNHASENEVLFAARTFFHVTKVEGTPGGQMTVYMEEMDDDER